jgi:hypothetical protein
LFSGPPFLSTSSFPESRSDYRGIQSNRDWIAL